MQRDEKAPGVPCTNTGYRRVVGGWLMRPPARSVCGVVAEVRHVHTDYRVLWRKRDGMATLSRGESPNRCLDRLLLLFRAQYIEDGPHVLCTGSL